MKSEETAWHDTSSCSSSDDNDDDDDDDYVDVFEGKHNANHRSKPVLRLQRFSHSPTKVRSKKEYSKKKTTKAITSTTTKTITTTQNKTINRRRQKRIQSPPSQQLQQSRQRQRRRTTTNDNLSDTSNSSSSNSSSSDDDDDDDDISFQKSRLSVNNKGGKKRITAIDGKKNNFDSDNDSDDTAELLRNLPRKSPPVKDDNMNMTSSSSPPLVRCFSPKKLSRNNNDITISSVLASNNGLCADSVEAAVDHDDDDKSSVDNMMERTRQLPIKRGCHKLERNNNDIVNGIPCSSKDNYSQQKPKGTLSQCSLKDCYTSSEEHTFNKQPPHDDTPIQFLLPPQSSSSEESGSDDDNDTDEDRGDEEEEKKEEEMDSNTEHISQTNDLTEGSYLNSEIRNPYVKTTTTIHHSRRMTNTTRDSFGGTMTNGNLLSTDDFTVAKQESNTQNQHRSYQQHQEVSLHTKSNEELFHESFLDGEINNDIVNTRRKDDVPSHQSGINNSNTSEPQYNKYRENEQPQQRIDQYNQKEPFEAVFVDHHASSSTNAVSSDFRHPPPQESSDQRYDDARTNKESFGEIFFDGHPPPTSQDDVTKHTNDMQQPSPQEYIDLVNSDSEGENQHNRHNNHQEHTSARVFHDNTDGSSSAQWGRQSPARSPKFNIAARGFIHNKPRATFTDNPNSTRRSDNHRSHDDDIHFEKNDRASMLPAPRRVTQYHANQLRRQEFQQQQHQQSNPTQQHTAAIGSIPRPWPPSVGRTTRRLRDATASNVSLAANVVSNKNRNLTSRLPTPSTTSVIQPSLLQRRNNTINTNTNNSGDIRNFVSRRPRLVDETRMRSMENVRSSRHDIQRHADVTMIKNPPPAAKRRSQQEEEDDDVIEVYKDETAPPAPARRARTRTTTTTRAKPKVKTKRKRATSRKAKPRKGGRKRTASTRGKGRGGNKFGRRGGAAGGGGDATSGAWGPTGGGWASAPPVHREDPAFQNVGAEISF